MMLSLYVHKNGKPVRPATEEEIETIYQQVNNIKHGQGVVADKYEPTNNVNMQDIRLREEDEEALFHRDLRLHAKDLRKNWPMLDELPDRMQRAMLDVQFNVGGKTFTPKVWGELKKALDTQNWKKAAKEISRDTKDKKRNEATINLVLDID